ncbi:MAG: hypothetical protein M9897_07055 [Brumimicrobium sp.]|nr:hypothetical protein [Brumimicrobium sp.]
MKNWLIYFVLFFQFISWTVAQERGELSGVEKAYIYHSVVKTPLFSKELGRYIDYVGKKILFPSGKLNLDSMEQLTMHNPDSLVIYTHAIRTASKGIVNELANKVALWKLNRMLQFKPADSGFLKIDPVEIERFNKLVYTKLPLEAKRFKDNNMPSFGIIEKIANPALTLNDKVAMLNAFSTWSEKDKMEVIEAYNYAINEWVKEKTYTIYLALGGEADLFENKLMAAGKGQGTNSENFVAREQDERGRLINGLPNASGFFPYEPILKEDKKLEKKNEEIVAKDHLVENYESFGKGRQTIVHFDVWGYSKEKQTTVVVQQGRSFYPLFGIKDSRFLSPDSSMAGGKSYMGIIHKMKKDILFMNDQIYGKKGIEYWIKYYEKQRDGIKLNIDKTEKDIGTIRQEPITTKTPKPRKKPSVEEQYSTRPPDLKTDKNRGVRVPRQEGVVSMYGALAAVEKAIKELKKQKEELLDKIQALTIKMHDMYALIGETWMKFTEKDGLYVFEDGTTFDIQTQDLVFPAARDNKDFQVKLLTIPDTYADVNFNEVMLHVGIVDAPVFYNSVLSLEKEDELFKKDSYELTGGTFFNANDSIGFVELYNSLKEKKKPLVIQLHANGIGKDYEGNTVRDDEQKILGKDILFKNNFIHVITARKTLIDISSFTLPVKTEFNPSNPKVIALKGKYQLSNNEVLTAYRAKRILDKFVLEAQDNLAKYNKNADVNSALKNLQKGIKKAVLQVGDRVIPLKEFN